MSDALAKINKRVKQLQKLHPNTQRKTLQKQAGREYKNGKLGRVKKTKKVGKVSRKHVVKNKRIGVAVNKSHKDRVDKKRVDITIGSVAKGVSMLRKKLIDEIGWNEAAKLTAKKPKSKREIQRKINEKKSLLRKLS